MARKGIPTDAFQEYLDAIDSGLKPQQPSILQALDTGMGDFKRQERTNETIPVPSPVGAPVSMGDFRRIDAETREPIPVLDYNVPANPNAPLGFDPETEWQATPTYVPKPGTVAGEIMNPFIRGASGVMSGAGGGLRMLGAEQLGKEMTDFYDRAAQSLPQSLGEQRLAEKPFEWKDTLTTDFWADGRAVASFMSAAGSSAPFAIGSFLAAALAPASLSGATTATIAGLGRAALSTAAGRATIGKLMTNPAMQKLAANTFGKIGDFGKSYIAARTLSAAPEALTEGGGSYNEMVKWNDAVNVLRNPQAGEGDKIAAKKILQEMYEQAGGKGPIDPDHVPTIDDAKLRAWKQTAANIPLLAASNALEGANLFTPSRGVLKGMARKAGFGALQNGPFEEYLQAGAETGIAGMGKQGTPIQGDDFVWSLNPAEWNPSTKNQVFGGALFGGIMGAAGGPVNVDPKKAEPGIVNQAVSKLFVPAQPTEAAPQPAAQPAAEVTSQPAAEPAPAKLKIGDVVPDDELGNLTFSGVTPEGKSIFKAESGEEFTVPVPTDRIDPSVFGKPAEQAGTVTLGQENGGLVANPGAKAPEANKIKPSESFSAGHAIWRTKDGDVPVNITGIAGGKDGMTFVNIEGSNTAVPMSEIVAQNNVSINPEKHDITAEPTSPPNSRWKIDPGAIPGEAEMFLDSAADGFDDAKAAIRQVVDDQGRATWEAVLPGGDSLGQFTSVAEAAAAAEKATGTTEHSFAVGDKVNSSKGAGTIAKVTKSGVAIKTADGKIVTVSFESMKKNAWVRKEESAADQDEYVQTPIQTNGDFSVGDKVSLDGEPGTIVRMWNHNKFGTMADVKLDDQSSGKITQAVVPVSEITKEQSNGFPSKPEYTVSAPAKIKVGDKVTRPGKNDSFEVVDASDQSMFVLKNLNNPDSKPFKTGKKSVVLVGSPEASAQVEPSPNDKQKLAWQKAYSIWEKAGDLAERAETDDGIDNPWPEVIEAMQAVLDVQNGDARLNESAAQVIKTSKQASKDFDADHGVGPDETVDVAGTKRADKPAAKNNEKANPETIQPVMSLDNGGYFPASNGNIYRISWSRETSIDIGSVSKPVELYSVLRKTLSEKTFKPMSVQTHSMEAAYNFIVSHAKSENATITGQFKTIEAKSSTTAASAPTEKPAPSPGATVTPKSPVAKSDELSDNGVEKEKPNYIDARAEGNIKAQLLGKKKPRKLVDMIADSDEDLANALSDLANESKNLSANPIFNPKLMEAALRVGCIYVQRGVNNFAEWSAKIVSAAGEKIKPYLPSVWKMIETFPEGEKYDQETVNLLFQYAGIQYQKGNDTYEKLSKVIVDELGKEFEPYARMAYDGFASWKEAVDSGRAGTANNQLPEGKPSEKADGRSNSDNQEDSAAADENVGNNDGQAATTPAGPRGGLDAEVSAKPDGGKRSGKQPNVGKRKNDVRNRNYVITEKDQLGKGGAVQKYNDNIAAIKLIHQLNEENRQATPEEQAILVKYVGWGGFPQLFDYYLRPDNEWYGRSRELKELLSPEEYSAARASTTNAHYTSETVVRAIWDGVKRLGFDGGKVLEPSMGTGNFFGLMPKDIRDSKLTGIELDKLTGSIAKQLYPDANIQITGFEKSPIPDEYYDLAISNVPFGDYSLHDPKYNKYKLNIHNYFFVKALDKVRPGGLVVFVTGSGTMQSEKQSAVRAMIAERAELLAAVKMPNSAFKENARTEVTTDVLFLRKLMPGESPTGHTWDKLADTQIKSGAYPFRPMKINEYFVKHPDMMLGELYEDKLHQGRLGLKDDGRDLGDALKKVLSKLPKGSYQQSAVKAPTVMDISQMIDAPGTAREGSVQVQGGKLFVVTNGKMFPKELDGKRVKAVAALVSIREHVREIMRAQLDPATTDEILTHRRAQLKKAYDDYVKEHGYLGASRNKSIFENDPDSGLIFGLEQYPDKKVKTPVLSDIFTTRTIQPFRKATDVSTPEEALVASLQETGRVNIGRIAALLNKGEEEVIGDLEGLIFHDPSTDKWETKEMYLSGNVRQKLVAAKEAAKADKKYSLNVSELEKVQPVDLKPNEIKAKLGSPWIPAGDIEDFVDHLMGSRNKVVTIKHDELSNTWLVSENTLRSYQSYDQTKNRQTWGTSRYSAIDLVDSILNMSKIQVKDKGEENEKPVVNEKETAAAQDKAEQIKKEFNSWIWSNPERATRLAGEYNTMFNAVRLPEYNGEHLQIPGLTTRISLRPHQKNAIWRIIQGGNALIAHGVGLGKTLVMQAAGMKLRQLGLSRKPLYVIPNSTISDFETKFREHFPAAKILVLSSKTLPAETPVTKKAPKEKPNGDGPAERSIKITAASAEATANDIKNNNIDKEKTAERIQLRRSILSRIATEDWDAILITNNMFTRLPMSPQSQVEFIQQTINDYAAAIESAKGENGNAKYVKELEKQKKRWEAKLQAALESDTKSIVTPFEELGIDYLFVDEADMFKNLGFATAMGRIAGVQNGDSKRALDMYSKTFYLNKVNNGSGVVFATGTPISNTMGEMFTMMRYMIPQRLRELTIGHFDTWAANFGETVASFERDVSGKGFRTVERFAKFVNAPELIKLFREFADVKRAEDVNLPLPKLRTGGWQTVVSPMSEELKRYIDVDIARRVAAIRSGSVKPDEDNMLVVTSDLRKAALDIRLVIPGTKLSSDSKINKAVDNLFRIWNDTKAKRSTQIVFCDMSIPKAVKDEDVDLEKSDDDEFEVEAIDASVYQTIQRMLIEKGVPKEEIAFIHDAKNKEQKQALFDRMNAGDIRVLIGSTGKAGVGLNVQNKLVAAHHLDVPWRPRDLEQRNGRIVRQGNENDEVDIYAYATEGSADSLMWERVSLKQRFIQHAMSDNLTDREIEEEDMALGFAEIAAITSGNPLLAEKVKLESQVTRLRLLREKHEGDKLGYKLSLANSIPVKTKAAQEKLKDIESDIAAKNDTSGDKFSVEISGKKYTDRKDAEEAIAKFIGENTFDTNGGKLVLVNVDAINQAIGKIGGMNIVTRLARIGSDQTFSVTNKSDGKTYQGVGGELRIVLEGPSGRTYNVLTPSINGIENRLRRMDDILKESQTELNNIEASKVELQKLIEKPFDREAEYQKLNTRLEEIIKELAETEREPENGLENDVTLNSGVDPFQLIPGLRKYSDMTAKEAFNDLVAIGRKVLEETSHGGRWMARMKELLGDVWAKAKKVMGKVWNEVKKTVSNNRGAIRIGGLRIEAEQARVPAGSALSETLQKKGWSAEVLPDGSTRLVRPQPKPVEVPSTFTPQIDGMDRRVAFEFEQSKELPKVPTKETLRENMDKFFAYASRKYKALPNEARFAPLKFALTQLEHKKGVATDATVRILDKITATLKTPKDYSIFCHKVVFDDIAADLEADENYEMPFGLTRENFQANYDAVNAAVTPEIQKAIDARKKAWQDFKEDYVQSMKDIGFNVENRLKKGDTYFHHIVLDYAELKNRLDPVLGSKLRTPNYRGFLKTREGSTKNIMTDYLHPEMEVMGQMMYDIEIAKTIKLVEDKYDISKKLRDAAKAKNFENLVGGPENVARIEQLEGELRELVDAGDKEGAAEIREELNELDPTRPYKQKIAMGFSKLDKLGIDPEDFAEISKLAKEEGDAGMAAATILKAISEREKFMQEALGENYLQWRNGVDHRIIPDGYEAWQPREGNLFFTGFTIPEHVAQAIADNAMQEIGVPAEQIRKVLAQGGRRREMIVPAEVSETLHNISPAKALQGWVKNGLRHIQGYWKQAVLTMPTRFASYNLNNMFGDLDAVIAAQGAKGLSKAGKAAKELYGVFYKGKEMSPGMRSWFERGGFESLLQTQEAGKVNQLKIFDRFMEKDGPIKNFPAKLWRGYWGSARKATDFRESILRYAKFLDYKEQMEQNNGRPKEFGASDPASVMALDDIDDRAFKLSNELLGAYDSISEMGQDMRSFVWPFWSWKEVNATRYIQMIKNATIDDRTALNVAAKVGGLALRKAPFAAIKAGTFLIKAGFLFALVNAYNWWVWPEEEKDLEDSVKYKMHLILGRDNDGKVRYIRTSGAFADLLGWVGWDTPMQHYDAWLSGRKSLAEIAIDSAVAPFNQIASGVTPYLKIPAEAVFGKTIYPDIRKPRPIHDRGEYLARSFALGEEYKAVFGLPHRPYDGSGFLPVKKSDPMQAAYYGIINAKQEWLKDKGKYNEGGFSSPKSEALRYYKEALRYQDEAAAVKYLEQYKLAGGTKEGMERSLEAMNPLSGMKKSDREEFIASLTPYDREKLDLAQAYFDMVLQRSGGQLKQTKKGNIDVKVNVDLPSEKKKKQGNRFYF